MNRADEVVKQLNGAFRAILRDLEDHEGIRVVEQFFLLGLGRVDGSLKVFEGRIGEDLRQDTHSER